MSLLYAIGEFGNCFIPLKVLISDSLETNIHFRNQVKRLYLSELTYELLHLKSHFLQ